MTRFTSDNLSPILVKELRQGIRSKLFLGSFVVIQLLLFLYGTSLLLSDNFAGDQSSALALFWSAIVLPLLILVPAMASQGIEKEISGKTLELLLLTRLSSYRLVLGKWMSVVVQSTLLVTSALPYLMLRYFLGGIDVWGELRSLGLLVLASALLAGITMGFWATNVSKLAKWGAVLLFLWLGPYMFVVALAGRGGLGGGAGMSLVVWVYAFIGLLIMLAHAASRIGPPAENHSTQIRILALLTIAAGVLFRGRTEIEVLSAVLALAILLPCVVAALVEKVRYVPRLYAPFVDRTGLARLAAFPFAPGWPSGLAFTVLVFGLVPFFPVWSGSFHARIFIAALGTVLVPAALVRTLLSPARQSLGLYALFLILLTIPMYVWGAALAFDHDGLLAVVESLVGFFPPVALALELSDPRDYSAAIAAVECFIVTAVSFVVLARVASVEWSRMTASRVPPSAVSPIASAAEGASL